MKRAFLDRLHEAREGKIHRAELEQFAEYCKSKSCCCITFNYDDFLDEALQGTDSWNPVWGYGFLCRTSYAVVNSLSLMVKDSELQLLKLHGSINWRANLGSASPFAIDSITYHHEWDDINPQFPQYPPDHLEPEPVMVPPILSKSSLVEQPILRLVWSQAFASLKKAHEVTFIGYSFPTTDIAARTLFSEALKDLPRKSVKVINLSRDEEEKMTTRKRYRSVLGDIPDEQFHWDGALEWIRKLSC